MAHSLPGAVFGQGAARGMDNPGEDVRMLAAVFQDIMPILARIQTRAPQTPLPGFAGQVSAETVAAVALVSDMGADSLRRLTAYLDANAGKFEGLENCAPLVAAAARALAARDYAQSFTLIFDAYRTIAMLRADDENMPLPGSIKNVSMDRRKGDAARQSDAANEENSSGQPH